MENQIKKIEFVKEVNGTEVVYFTEIDGGFVPGTLRISKDEAYDVYKTFISLQLNGEPLKERKILESVEI